MGSCTEINMKLYQKQYHDNLLHFLEVCLPQSGRRLDLNGRHKMYHEIEKYFMDFGVCLIRSRSSVRSL